MTCSIEHESASVKVSQQRSSKGYKSLSRLARILQARRRQMRDWVKLGKHDEGNSVRVLGIGQRNPRLDQARIRLLKRDKNLFQRDQDSLGIDVWARLHAYNLRNKYHNQLYNSYFYGIRYLHPKLQGFVCNQFKWEISQNICNGSPRYLELNQIEESGNQ